MRDERCREHNSAVNNSVRGSCDEFIGIASEWHTPSEHQIENTDQVINHLSLLSQRHFVSSFLVRCRVRVACGEVIGRKSARRTPSKTAKSKTRTKYTFVIPGQVSLKRGAHLDADGHSLELPVVVLPAGVVVVARVHLPAREKAHSKGGEHQTKSAKKGCEVR